MLANAVPVLVAKYCVCDSLKHCTALLRADAVPHLPRVQVPAHDIP